MNRISRADTDTRSPPALEHVASPQPRFDVPTVTLAVERATAVDAADLRLLEARVRPLTDPSRLRGSAQVGEGFSRRCIAA